MRHSRSYALRSPPSSAARVRSAGMGPRGETDALVAHTPAPASAASRTSLARWSVEQLATSASVPAWHASSSSPLASVRPARCLRT